MPPHPHIPTPPPHHPMAPACYSLPHSQCVLTHQPESSCKSISPMRQAPAFRCQCLPSSSKIKDNVLARCEGSSQVRPLTQPCLPMVPPTLLQLPQLQLWLPDSSSNLRHTILPLAWILLPSDILTASFLASFTSAFDVNL